MGSVLKQIRQKGEIPFQNTIPKSTTMNTSGNSINFNQGDAVENNKGNDQTMFHNDKPVQSSRQVAHSSDETQKSYIKEEYKPHSHTTNSNIEKYNHIQSQSTHTRPPRQQEKKEFFGSLDYPSNKGESNEVIAGFEEAKSRNKSPQEVHGSAHPSQYPSFGSEQRNDEATEFNKKPSLNGTSSNNSDDSGNPDNLNSIVSPSTINSGMAIYDRRQKASSTTETETPSSRRSRKLVNGNNNMGYSSDVTSNAIPQDRTNHNMRHRARMMRARIH